MAGSMLKTTLGAVASIIRDMLHRIQYLLRSIQTTAILTEYGKHIRKHRKTGRWGYTIFQGDRDLDIGSEFEEVVGVSIHDEPVKLEEARIKLDDGLGVELFKKYRAKEHPSEQEYETFEPKYTTLMLGAYMMHVGAKITPEDRQHLKNIFPDVPSRNGYVMPIGDDGFRDPGQVQYKMALENYVNGTPRGFFAASCFNCGKTSQDIAPAKLKCCIACKKDDKTASYCDRECQKENWKNTR